MEEGGWEGVEEYYIPHEQETDMQFDANTKANKAQVYIVTSTKLKKKKGSVGGGVGCYGWVDLTWLQVGGASAASSTFLGGRRWLRGYGATAAGLHRLFFLMCRSSVRETFFFVLQFIILFLTISWQGP